MPAQTAAATCLVLTVCTLASSADAFGFCLDNVPEKLRGTGFTGLSSFASRQECQAAGHRWCPLSNETDTWEVDGAVVEYYWFSACCSGRQGRRVIPDAATGVPTCESGLSHEACTSTEWRNKLMRDLVEPDSGYDYTVMPSSVLHPSPRAPRQRTVEWPRPTACSCAPSDPRCTNVTSDGTACMVCRTRDPCGQDAVSVGLHFFKLHTVDLKTSVLTFAAWIRQSWRDPRLTYNAQCYGGLEQFEVVAQTGSLENSVIWTPDLELYNGEESIWQGNIHAHLAVVYPCSSTMKPAVGPCGWIFWSRPGLVKALCMYEGLLTFPMDTLSCKLEVAAFSVDGRQQDVVLRAKDGGVSWSGKEGGGMTGLTSGSTFQDYRIVNITSERYVTYYDCCPNSPFPTLVYRVLFKRSRSYYMVRILLPPVLLALISFFTFWMDPAIGERLGFGITVILAMLTNDVVAATFMPIADEKLLIDYLSLGCSVFGVLSLFETAVVLFVYHHGAPNWKTFWLPKPLLLFWANPRDFLLRHFTTMTYSRDSGFNSSTEWRTMMRAFTDQYSIMDTSVTKESRLRHQLYRQIFFMFDTDFNGSLSFAECEEFCTFILGSAWHSSKAKKFIKCIDKDGNGTISFQEFVAFCETNIPHVDDIRFLKIMTDGFVKMIDRKKLAVARMWHGRAKFIDQFARWSVPSGFILFLAVLFTHREQDLEALVDDSYGQFFLIFTGHVLLAAAIVAVVLFKVYGCFLRRTRTKQARETIHAMNPRRPVYQVDPTASRETHSGPSGPTKTIAMPKEPPKPMPSLVWEDSGGASVDLVDARTTGFSKAGLVEDINSDDGQPDYPGCSYTPRSDKHLSLD